jgi:hypothetical protein
MGANDGPRNGWKEKTMMMESGEEIFGGNWNGCLQVRLCLLSSLKHI